MLFGWGRKRQSESSSFGDYQIIKLVHEGYKATVYQGRRRQSDELCAIKLYHKPFDREMRRLRKKYKLPTEGEIGLALNPLPTEDAASHPIVRTLGDGREFGRSSRAYYVVQEYVDGYNLKNLITVGPEQLNGRRLALAIELARGMDVIHRRGYVHRDLSSDNVLITRQWNVKIIDLGFVAPVDTSPDERTGTPSYMAPEQIRGGKLTSATDIYACGVMLYEIFTGKLPFGTGARGSKDDGTRAAQSSLVLSLHLDTAPKPPREIAPQLPEVVEQIVLRCLEKDPAARFHESYALMSALQKAQGQHGEL